MSRGLKGRLAKLERDEAREGQARGRPRVVLYLPCKLPVEEGGEGQAPGRSVCPHTGVVTVFYDASAGDRPWDQGEAGDP
jgi:hypothetical protein